MTISERESLFAREILSGNVPSFLRNLRPVHLQVGDAQTIRAIIHATPDYLAVGSDTDHILVPLTPACAQSIADRLGCNLPTTKIVDAIHAQADVRLVPQPMSPGPYMTSFTAFADHQLLIRAQLSRMSTYSPGLLVAGHKKDVVISCDMATTPGKVAIYGWHRTNGIPIQPLYKRHSDQWVDYSHGIRLVADTMQVEGTNTSLRAALRVEDLSRLLSDEGPLTQFRYIDKTNHHSGSAETTNPFGERVRWLSSFPDVRIQLNEAAGRGDTNALLILYALPNGNTIEQTVGRVPEPGEDPRFQIQHIAGQTRYLRSVLTNQDIVVAYLEASGLSWPAWRKRNGDDSIPRILEAISDALTSRQTPLVVLSGHSGGGSFTFGYLNAVSELPGSVVRIAFLDSNYAYDSKGHYSKLKTWLNQHPGASLCVLAYDDANALLNGKSFVSAQGGTWGRSHAMLSDLTKDFTLTESSNAGIRKHSGAAGRIQFFLKENPERLIWHTVQVEKNGFIHSLLTGTSLEERGYKYLGEPCYRRWIGD